LKARAGLKKQLSRHFQRASFDRAALLIQRLTFIVIGRDKHNMILDWLNRLPQQLVSKDLAICILGSTANEAIRDVDKSRLYSQKAKLITAFFEDDAASKDSDAATALGFLAGIEALGYFYAGDFNQAKNICLRQLEKTPMHEDRAQCILNYVLGMFSWAQGELETSYKYYLEAQKLARIVGYDYLALHSTGNLANINFARGHLNSAAEDCRTAIQMGTTGTGVESAVLCYAYLLLANIYYQWNDLSQALTNLQHALDLSAILPEPVIHLNSTICTARVHLAEKNKDEALKSAARRSSSRKESLLLHFWATGITQMCLWTRLWLSIGNPGTAQDHARRWIGSLELSLRQLKLNGVIAEVIKQNLYGSDIRNIWTEKELLTTFG